MPASRVLAYFLMALESQQLWLTASESAQYLKVKARTLLMWARQGKLKGYVLSGTRRHLPKDGFVRDSHG